MREIFKKSVQMNLLDTPNATSSPASADGLTPCDSLDGQTIAPSGPAPARANLSATPACEKASKTKGTYGPSFPGLSPSENLQRCLESRLQAALDVNGSPEYVLTWKQWAMQSGAPICALRARARRTSDKGFIGWPTPTARDGRTLRGAQDRPGKEGGPSLSHLILKGWASPRANKYGNADSHGNYQKPLSVSMAGVELNPNFNRWLMGYPLAWFKSAATVTPLSRKSRRK